MRKILTITFLTIMFWAPALADQITLKNGDRLTGKIVKSEGGKLVIKTQLIGDVSVDLSAVTSITTDEPLYVTLAGGRTVEIAPVNGDLGRARLAHALGVRGELELEPVGDIILDHEDCFADRRTLGIGEGAHAPRAGRRR